MKDFKELQLNELEEINGGNWWSDTKHVLKETGKLLINSAESYMGEKIIGKIIGSLI